MVELDGFDAWRSANLANGAGKSLGIGEGLAWLSDGVDDEANFSRPNSIVCYRISLEVITGGKRHSKSMLSRPHTLIILDDS